MNLQEMPTRQQVLYLLKMRGRMTVKQLSEALGITPMGVRQHLDGLVQENLVSFEWLREGRGRPSQIFHLTPKGDELFPRSYDTLALSLLEEVRALGGEEAVEQVFARRTQKLHDKYAASLQDLAAEERIAEFVRMRDAEGHLARWERIDDDTYRIVEHNCPVCMVANRFPQACRFEHELFEQILGPEFTVQREEHIGSGDRQCRYILTKKRQP